MSLCEVPPPEVAEEPESVALGVGLEVELEDTGVGDVDGIAFKFDDLIHLVCLRLWTQVGPAKPVGRIEKEAATAKAKVKIERRIMVPKC